MNPEGRRFRGLLTFPSLNLWVCVEREVSEEGFERRRDWDHARHEERVNPGRSTDAARVSWSITRPGFGRLKTHVSLRPLHLPPPCLIATLCLPSRFRQSPQSQIHPTNAPGDSHGTTHSEEALLASYRKLQKRMGNTLDRRTSLSASLRLPLSFRLSLRNGAAVNTAFTVRGSRVSQHSVIYAVCSDIYRRK